MARIIYNGGSNQRVIGTNAADEILSSVPDTGSDTIFAQGGDDEVRTGGGNDLLLGGSGGDLLSGGDGNDRLFGGTGDDKLFGGGDNDTLAVETGLGGFGTDILSGGDGFDKIVFQTANVINVNGLPASVAVNEANAGVTVNMINEFVPGFVATFQQGAGGDIEVFSALETQRGFIRDSNGTTAVFNDIEQIDLTNFDDNIFDSSASHIINGRNGDDYISGGGGFDVIDGGNGNDTAVYFRSDAAVSISLLDFGSGGSGSGGEAEGDKLFSIENVFASGHNDFVLGNAANNTLLGLGGNDTLLAGGGTDTVDGGNGDDTLRGGLGNDTVVGGEGSDTALFLDWNGTPDAIFTTFSTSITLADGGNASSAKLLSTTFQSRPFGFVTTTLETDTLTGIENVIGTEFADTITGNSADNELDGRDGNDILDGGQGSDTLIGGDGIDTAQFIAGGTFNFPRVEASLADGEATVFRNFRSGLGFTTVTETDTLSGIENLTGSTGADKLTGNSGANTLDGGGSGDILAGLGGADKLIGGDGSDTADYTLSAFPVQVNLATGGAVDGDAGGDTFISIENLTGSNGFDRLTGNSGVNIIKGLGGDDTIEGGASGDTLDGGTGINTLSYENAIGVNMSLDGLLQAAGDALGDIVSNFQNLSGSLTGGDTLRGNAGGNIIKGNGGGDLLSGGLGADTLDGGEGFDFADYRNDGAVNIDLLNGIFQGAAVGDSFIAIEGIVGGFGDNTIKGTDLDDEFITFSGSNTLQGRGGVDTLTGGSGQDTIIGGEGNDSIAGGIASDELSGNADADTLNGNGGGDRLNGGTGSDSLTGGAGRDTFIFNGNNSGADEILDWTDGIDTIEFNSNLVDSFADLAIAGNGTGHVTVIFGNNSIEIFSGNNFTLTAQDFSIL